MPLKIETANIHLLFRVVNDYFFIINYDSDNKSRINIEGNTDWMHYSWLFMDYCAKMSLECSYLNFTILYDCTLMLQCESLYWRRILYWRNTRSFTGDLLTSFRDFFFVDINISLYLFLSISLSLFRSKSTSLLAIKNSLTPLWTALIAPGKLLITISSLPLLN